jgi:cytosine/adenosine deaminase-related metal-dependent hydrolase
MMGHNKGELILSSITNAHTHLELGWLADMCPDENGADFFPWLQRLTERWRQMAGCYAQAIYHKAVLDGIAALVNAGTTHVGDISATGASIGPLLESGLQGVVYVEVVGIQGERADRVLNAARYLIEEWRSKERNGMRLGLTIHTPYTVHPTLWKKGLEYARAEGLPLCIHVAESQAEYDYLLHDTGMMAENRDQMGYTFSVPHKTPVQYLEDIGALDLKPLLVHAVHVTDDDLRRIQASGSTVAHCPRSNARLRCGRMPLEKYLEHSIPVLLGTDSLASSPSLNIHDEVDAAVALHAGKVAPETVRALLEQPGL